MYCRLQDFLSDFSLETENTKKLFLVLTDASLLKKSYKSGRTLGFIAWHIVLTLGEMCSKVGITAEAPPEDAPQPESASDILSTYIKASESIRSFIEKNWSDSTLQEEHDMYGAIWKNNKTLQVLLRHEIHHRAQLTILMRQAGLKVPGLYGPSLEEWTNYGMPAQP